MSIRRKFFLTLVSSLLALFLVFSGLSIFYFQKSTGRQLESSMNTLISYNTSSLNGFMTSIHQIALHLVSDKAFGELLSFQGDRVIDQIENREALYIQFTHYSLFYNTEYTYFENTLFLDEALPSASMFPVADIEEATRTGSYKIYKDSMVKNHAWYQDIKKRGIATHAFYDEESEKILFVRRLQNTYYTGPWKRDGIGTLVISISPENFIELVSMRSLTPNSAYLIMNADKQILLSKNAGEELEQIFTAEDPETFPLPEDGGSFSAAGKTWIMYSRSLRNDLRIIYLTPRCDVQHIIWETVRPTLIMSAAFLLLIAVVAFIFSNYFTAPIVNLSKDISEIKDARTYDASVFEPYKDQEMKALCSSFDDMMTNINRLTEARQESERKSREMELRSLQAQINPHFLFNAMDLVNWLALSRGQDDLADIVASIAEILRYSITEADSLIPVKDELVICKTYISIYRLRYGNIMELDHPDEKELDYFIPKFCLQPLVENAIRHSSETHEEPLHMVLSHRRKDGMTELRLCDDGRGNDPDLLNRFLKHEDVPLKVSHGFGIRNVNERLKLKFQGKGSLHYEKDEKGRLCAVLTFPYITDKQNYLQGDQNGEEQES